MPSFGVSSSMPPGSSSLSPCISTLVSSNTSSGPETSCAPLPDGCMSHLFGPLHLPPPPPLSLSDAAPYSPPPAYPPVFPFGPPLLPSARFPPPPNPSWRPISNITYFEPQPHYPPEPHTAYDRWSDRSANCSPYGGDHLSKSFSHWPLPTFNSGININGNTNNNPSMGFLKPETLFPPVAPYPPVDSVTNFGPKFSPLSGFPNAAGMPSTPSASITSPLASSHFGAFPPPNVPLGLPHSSGRFPYIPHASTFLPGMDPPPAFASGTAEFMPEPIPSYLSRHGTYQPSSSFQAPDHFHDPSPHPILSPDTTPHPVASDSLSFYFPPQTFHGSSDFLSHTFSSRSDIAPAPLCSSEGAPILDLSAPFNSPYPPPIPGSLFSPFSSGPPLYQEPPKNRGGTSSPQRDDELRDRIVGETGKLMYQHMSPEEWRWKHYEPSFVDALDPSGIFARVRSSGYNCFHGVDSTVYSAVPNSSSGFVVTEERSPSGGSKSESEQEDILQRSKAQNQPGPSLKLAASALAEMLASGSNGASFATSRSMLSQVEANPGTSFTFDGGFQSENSSSGGQARTEIMLEDCCSSSGSAVFRKEGRDGCGCLGHECGGLTAEGYVSGLNLGSPTRSKREISELPEDAFCEFGGAIGWPLPKASGQVENPTNLRPMSWVDAVVPQSAKGGAMPSSGQRRVFSKGSAGIMRQPSVTTGSAKIHEANASSDSTLEDCNIVFRQSSNLSSRPESGSVMRNVCPPVGVQPSHDPTSVIGPFASTVTPASGLSLFGPHEELSSATSTPLPLDLPRDHQRHANSTSCGSSPPLSQAYLEKQRSISGTTLPTTETASGLLANLKWSCPESSSHNEVTYLGSGFHSLTASISNLSKVLFSLDSAALTPPDAAALEETLQSSILRLSECLLLEQSRIHKNPATRFVGSDESSASRQGRAEGPLPDFDVGRHAETVGSTNLGHLKASDVSFLPNATRNGSSSQPCNVNERRATGTGVPLEIFDSNWNTFQGPLPSNNDSQSVSKGAMNDVDVKVDGRDSRHGCPNNPRGSSSSKQKGAVGDDIIQLLRVNDILERSSLERLIGAEAREARLKVLVEELREELELERVENRGTALLCEKIMQEAEIAKGKALRQGAQKADVGSKKETSTLDRSCKSEASGVDGQPDLTRHEKGHPQELGEKVDSTSQVKSGEEPFLNKIDEVESRLALLRARPALTPQHKISNDSSESELEEDIDAVAARENRSENVILDNSDHGESQRTLQDFSQDTFGSVESRFALLQSRRPTAMHEYRLDDAIRDINESVPYLSGGHAGGQDTTLDGVEARLALIHGRPGWDDELGVFTETEPCTPALDLESGRGSFPTHSLSGFYEDRVAFADRALKAMNQITSQLLVQSETISDMHTAWSQLSEQVNSKKEPMTEPLQQKEAGIQAVEARALMIRSRPDWTDGNASEGEAEDFLGQVCKISSTNSGCARDESDQFEMMNEISLVRLLDSDVESSQPLQVNNATDCQSLQGALGDTDRAESSKLGNGNPAPAQDTDDDSDSWEHVRFPQKDSE